MDAHKKKNVKGKTGKNKAGPPAGGMNEGCCAKCGKANIECLCDAVEQMKASLFEYACVLQGHDANEWSLENEFDCLCALCIH